MMFLTLATSAIAASSDAVVALGAPASFDCAMRKLAYTYGKQLLPSMGTYESLYYALNLNSPDCNASNALTNATAVDAAAKMETHLPNGTKLYVHPTLGDDSSRVGSMDKPLRTIQEALDRAAARWTTYGQGCTYSGVRV